MRRKTLGQAKSFQSEEFGWLIRSGYGDERPPSPTTDNWRTQPSFHIERKQGDYDMNAITDVINLAYAKIAFARIDLKEKLKTTWQDDRGVTAIEYGLIAALIAVVIISAVTLVGTELDTTFDTISAKLKTANAST
jgi:pilus assembly protein Flp/PilA